MNQLLLQDLFRGGSTCRSEASRYHNDIKYKIDLVTNTVARKCRLYLRGDWREEGVNLFRNKTFGAVFSRRVNRRLYSLACCSQKYVLVRF